MRKILITGGAGFIGANFVHYILEKFSEDHVVVFDKLTYSGNRANLAKWDGNKRYSFFKGDITNKSDIESAITDELTHVVHFAAESHVDRSITGPEEFLNTNIMGTFRILERIRELGWTVESGKKMLHVSTDEVYGTLGAEGYFTEETCYQPNSPYSASKASSDHIVRSYYHTYKIPVVTTNCSNNYGPYQFPEKLIPLMTINALLGKSLPVYGKGDNIRDWLHVEDHCSAIETVLSKGRYGETYAIGGRSEKTNMEIINMICSLMDKYHPEGAPHSSLIKYVTDRLGHDFRYAIDCTKIERELGWKQNHTFEEGLRETVEWYLNNKKWWEDIISGEYKKYYAKQYGEKR